MASLSRPLERVDEFLRRVAHLNARYRGGEMRAHVPDALADGDRPLEELVEQHLPKSHAALAAASRSLFFSLPVAFDPSESVGPYLGIADRDGSGEPYRFLDMGALIATQAFGENDPRVVEAIVDSLPFVTSRYAHSEYQTTLSLGLKAELNRIAPAGTPRHFIVNTGAEAVENAIKSVLLNRVKTSDEADGGFIVSFEGAFHGRTLGSLAVTHRKKARLGFPTFDWPHILFPLDEPRAPKESARREERSLKQLWDLLVSGRLPRADKSKDTFRRDMDALDEFLAQPGGDVNAFVQAQRAALTPDVVRRARRVAAVLVEPIQGEGGVRVPSARFMKKLRLLTRIYDVPLIFDEVQTGWGMSGRLWAHELFDLPSPPDVVTWAKKAQNGVLFVSEELATFFQEEKKFNTTWEGDSVGMVRLLATNWTSNKSGAPASEPRPVSRRSHESTARSSRTSAASASCSRSTSCAPIGATLCATGRSAAGSSCCRPANGCFASIRATTPSHRRLTRRCRSCASPSKTSPVSAPRRNRRPPWKSASAPSQFRSTRSRRPC